MKALQDLISRKQGDGVRIGSMRARARAPRIALYALVGVLSFAGLRATLAPAEQTVARVPVVRAETDQAALSFAEAFVRVYLTWEAGKEAERELQLEPFLPDELDADGGLEPTGVSSQEVVWTAVTGSERVAGRTNVVVVARTSDSTLQLSVPVARSKDGFLSIAAYPAIVGPPIVDEEASVPEESAVEDAALEAVVTRAVENYLALSRTNLMADLDPEAIVTLPNDPLDVLSVGAVTWVEPRRRVAATVEAEDGDGNYWTLRYELSVRKSDRWYVRSLQVNPTFEGGS